MYSIIQSFRINTVFEYNLYGHLNFHRSPILRAEIYGGIFLVTIFLWWPYFCGHWIRGCLRINLFIIHKILKRNFLKLMMYLKLLLLIPKKFFGAGVAIRVSLTLAARLLGRLFMHTIRWGSSLNRQSFYVA